MATQSDDEGTGGAERRDISQTRRYVKDVRAQYYQQLNSGGVGQQIHRDLQTAVLRYWDVLHEFDEDIPEFWEEHNLDAIPRLAEETVTVTRPTAGYGSGSERTTKPKIATVPATRLVQITHTLDRAAKELGFAAEPEEGITRTEITEDEIEEFQEWAKQTLEQNPGGGIEDVE